MMIPFMRYPTNFSTEFGWNIMPRNIKWFTECGITLWNSLPQGKYLEYYTFWQVSLRQPSQTSPTKLIFIRVHFTLGKGAFWSSYENITFLFMSNLFALWASHNASVGYGKIIHQISSSTPVSNPLISWLRAHSHFCSFITLPKWIRINSRRFLSWYSLPYSIFMSSQGVRNTLSAEESQVEHLKDQLKELFRFSQDSRHLSDDVLAVVKEHQRYERGSELVGYHFVQVKNNGSNKSSTGKYRSIE